MPDTCTVLIASAELITPLTARVASNGELLTFTDTDALRALDVIMSRRPRVVALEKKFAETPRGVALIARIKADPALLQSEIQVLSPEAATTRVLPAPAPSVPAEVVKGPLDQHGTRRAPRVRIKKNVDALLDGNPAALVDLSIVGAQVVSQTVLKPNQKIRMLLSDEQGQVRFNATVAWASFEMPPKVGPRYRAGVNFLDADASAVDAFCGRHREG